MYVCLSTRCGGRRGGGEVGRNLWERTRRQPGMSEGKEALRTSVPLVLVFLSDSLFLSLHLLRKSSYEPLIFKSSVLRRPFARAWVCTCAYAYNRARVARPWKRHTPLPLLGHLPSPSSPRGTRGRLVWEIERVHWVCPTIRNRASKEIFSDFSERRPRRPSMIDYY